jgi:hypothetical protein
VRALVGILPTGLSLTPLRVLFRDLKAHVHPTEVTRPLLGRCDGDEDDASNDQETGPSSGRDQQDASTATGQLGQEHNKGKPKGGKKPKPRPATATIGWDQPAAVGRQMFERFGFMWADFRGWGYAPFCYEAVSGEFRAMHCLGLGPTSKPAALVPDQTLNVPRQG